MIDENTNGGAWIFFGKIIVAIIFVIVCTFLAIKINKVHAVITSNFVQTRPESEDFNFRVTWYDHAPVYTNEIELLPDGKIWFKGIDMYDAGPPYDTLDMTLSGTYQIENLK